MTRRGFFTATLAAFLMPKVKVPRSVRLWIFDEVQRCDLRHIIHGHEAIVPLDRPYIVQRETTVYLVARARAIMKAAFAEVERELAEIEAARGGRRS